MFLPDLVVRSRSVVTARGTRPGAIHIRHGKIIGVLEFEEVLPDSPLEDVAGAVLPGLVDLDAETADVAGGVTSVARSAIVVRPAAPRKWFGKKQDEAEIVKRIIDGVRQSGAATHIAPLLSHDSLTPVFHAQMSRLPVTAGTSVGLLARAANERERKNREYFWAALMNGLIRTVAGGSLPAIWPEAKARGCTLEQIAEWMSGAPAKLAGLSRKGKIDAGFDADLVVFDPGAGVVEQTFVQGERVYSRN